MENPPFLPIISFPFMLWFSGGFVFFPMAAAYRAEALLTPMLSLFLLQRH